MADYNSPWTGLEIDQGVYDIGRVKNFMCVWGACGEENFLPSTCVSVNLLKKNPETGSNLGIYLVVYSDLNVNLNNNTATTNVGILIITNESQHAGGSSTTWINDATGQIHTAFVHYEGHQFKAVNHIQELRDRTGNVIEDTIKEEWYIHSIYRYQNLQATP